MSEWPPPGEEPPEPWFAPLHWAITLLCVGAVLVAGFVPLPGIDGELLGAWGLYFPISITVGLGWLVPFRALRAWTDSDDAKTNAAIAAGYLLAAAYTGWSAAVSLEQAGMGDVSLVMYPGLAFQLQVAMTVAAMAAVAWLMANWLSRSGIASGPLLIGATAAIASIVDVTIAEGIAAAYSGDLPWHSISLAAACVAMLGLVAWRSPTWPAKLGSFPVRSPVDLVLLPIVAADLALTAAAQGAQGPLSTLLTVLAAPAAVVLAGRWLLEADTQPGSKGWLAFMPVPVALLGGLTFAGFAASGGVARFGEPGPYDGELNVRVTLSASGEADRDADVLSQRLSELGVDARVKASPGSVQIELHDVGDVDGLMAHVLPPYHLGIHSVVNGAGRDVVELQDCTPGYGCETLFVEPAAITNAHIADATVSYDQIGTAIVLIDFSYEGRGIFGRLTERNVNKRMAIVLDGRPVSVPVVREPITGGRAQIHLGYGDADPEATAKALAAALRHEPLGGHYTLQSVDEL